MSDLAATTGAHPRSLYRVLRAAANVGVFAEDDDGRFGLTSTADHLRLLRTGASRREDEWAALLEAAGFALTKVHPTTGMVSLLEANPV